MIKFDLGHYTDFKLPSNSTIPEQLQQTLQTVWDRKYDDLYETGGKCNVEEAFVEVMTAFGMPNDANIPSAIRLYGLWNSISS
jgi:hypothetical protein